MPSSSSSSASSTSTSLTSATLLHNLQPQPSTSTLTTTTTKKKKISSSSAEAERSILQSALDTLEQPMQMLRDGIVTDEHLSTVSTLVPGSTVGKHLRHVHDHYRILLSSLNSSYSSSSTSASLSSDNNHSNSDEDAHQPEIDYDQRPPSPSLETSAQTCLKEFESISNSLRGLIKKGGNWYEKDFLVRATTPYVMEFKSSVGRELWFVSLHSIHHYALARAILTRELGLGDVIGNSFGVAPSTIVHRAWKGKNNESKL